MVGRPDIVGGHYHVQKKIGEGSFGVIYQGYNDINQRLVAIKFVRTPSLPRVPADGWHAGP